MQEIGIRELLEQFNARLTRVENTIEDLRREIRVEINELRRKISTNFRWTIGIVLTMWVTLIIAIILR